MKKDDFPKVEVSQPGTYRLIDDATLEILLNNRDWMQNLEAPSPGLPTLAFVVRFFRVTMDLSVRELSVRAGIHRNQIIKIEKADLKRKPHRESLERLAGIFGDRFRTIMRIQGFL